MTELAIASAHLIDAFAYMIELLSFPLMVFILLKALKG